MKRIKVGLSIGLVADRQDVIEVDDDATEQDIEQEVKDWASNYIEFWHEHAEDAE